MKQCRLYIFCRESTTPLEPRGVVCLKSTNVSESLSPLMHHLFLKGPFIKMEEIHKNVLCFLKWTRLRLVMLGNGKAQGSQTGLIPVPNPLGVHSQREGWYIVMSSGQNRMYSRYGYPIKTQQNSFWCAVLWTNNLQLTSKLIITVQFKWYMRKNEKRITLCVLDICSNCLQC